MQSMAIKSMAHLKLKSLKIARTALLGLTLSVGLSACVKDQAIGGPVPEVGFQHLTKIQLNVAEVNVKSNYKGRMQSPNVEHRFITSPERAMFDWALTRLVATGGKDYPAIADFVIEDASVLEVKIEKTEGFKAMFTYEPTTRYDANAVATFSIKNPVNGASGNVRIAAKRSIEVSENATLAEREQVWMTLVESLMADFNTQMDVQIQGYMARWVATPGLQ